MPAISGIDYEEEYQRQRIAWLESISQQAERAKSALHFAWINATCHREIFDYFDVDPTMTPTVVFYTAGKNKHTTMIGKFDHKTVVEQSDLFVTGKLPVFKPKIDLRDIIIKDIDCS